MIRAAGRNRRPLPPAKGLAARRPPGKLTALRACGTRRARGHLTDRARRHVARGAAGAWRSRRVARVVWRMPRGAWRTGGDWFGGRRGRERERGERGCFLFCCLCCFLFISLFSTLFSVLFSPFFLPLTVSPRRAGWPVPVSFPCVISIFVPILCYILFLSCCLDGAPRVRRSAGRGQPTDIDKRFPPPAGITTRRPRGKLIVLRLRQNEQH